MDKTYIRPQFAAALGAELARLRRRVDALSQSVEGLALGGGEPAWAHADLDARLDALARALTERIEDSAEVHQRLLSQQAELTALTGAVSALRQALTERMGPLEEGLAALAARLPPEQPGQIDAPRHRLGEVAADCRELGGRARNLERRLEAAETLLGASSGEAGDEPLRAETEALERRVLDLTHAFETALGATREAADQSRLVLERRQGRLAARLGTGLTLIALLGLTLLGALGWWAQSELRSADGRLAALEARPLAESVDRPPIPVSPPNGPLRDLDARYTELSGRVAALSARLDDDQAEVIEAEVAALAESQTGLAGRAAELAAASAGLEERIEGLGARQGAILDRLDGLEPVIERLSQRLDGLEARVGGRALEAEVTAATAPQAVPEASAAPADPAPDAGLAGAEAAGAVGIPVAEAVSVGTGRRVLAEERHVVQLIGFRSASSLAPFAARLGISGAARYLRSHFRGQTWFLVVLGDYASEAEAQAALTGLPDELRALDPMVRSLPAGTELWPIE